MRFNMQRRWLNIFSISILFAFISGIATHSIVFADDTGSSTPAPINIEKAMTKARALIEKNKLKKATKQLRKVVKQDKSNADAWNLLGYSWRKLDKNKKSGKAYAKALKLDPNHKGALEYQGELFIKLGELDNAKANLSRLKALCPDGCQELENLENALAGNSSY